MIFCAQLTLDGILGLFQAPDAEEISRIKAKYKHHDWRTRPLEGEPLLYGRNDVRYLLTVLDVLLYKISEADVDQERKPKERSR